MAPFLPSLMKSVRTVSPLGGSNGELFGGVDAYLPFNAIITSVRFYMAPGATTKTTIGWDYTVKNSVGASVKPLDCSYPL